MEVIEFLLSSGNVLLLCSIILVVAIFAAKSGARFGTPTLLLFLIIGMLFGSDGLGVQFNSPKTAEFIGMLALSVILFSGGMDTKYAAIRPVIAEGMTLATLGVLLTAMLTGLFIYFISGVFGVHLSLTESFLLAAVMSSTDSASVFSLLRSKRQGLSQNLRPLLELESGSNDPMAYILTIILVQAVAQGGIDIWQAVLTFIMQMSIGAVAGYLLGKAAVYVLNHINLNNKSLYSVLLLALVYLIFSLTDLVGGNGYLAVYIAGLVVGNHKIVYQKSLTTFFDGYTWLFQIGMFISLGLLVNPHEMLDVVEIGLLVGVFMILVSRPLTVFLCLWPFRKITLKGKLYVSWVGLRGAVPIIFATYPLVAGLENAGMIFNTVFFITIVSLLVQGTTVSSMANALGLSTKLQEDSFGIDIPDEISAQLTEKEVKEAWLVNGNRLRDLAFDDHTLVMMVRRQDDYIVPKGDTELMVGDKILCITGENAGLPDDYTVTPRQRFVSRMRGAFRRRSVSRDKAEKTISTLESGDEESRVYAAAESGDTAEIHDFDVGTEDFIHDDPRFDEDIMEEDRGN